MKNVFICAYHSQTLIYIHKMGVQHECCAIFSGFYILLKSITDVFDKVTKKYGPPDIIVFNSGIIHEFEWQKCLDINLVRLITAIL